MKFLSRYLFLVICLFYSITGMAGAGCDAQSLAQNPQSVLGCYIASSDDIKTPWVIDIEEHDSRGVSIETYKLTTQEWPKPWMSKHGSFWKQRLVIYQPDTIKSTQALLFINGGSSSQKYNADNAPEKIDFVRIAASTNSVVVDLQDIPNEYLTLDDNKPRKEDELVAYTWTKFLNHPFKNAYWPLQVPMTKSVVKAMTAVQEIVLRDSHVNIRHFVVSGISKRGLATWLTALEDNRVNAIVPIAINTLDMQATLSAIYSNYNNSWPPAFHAYIKEGIPARINTSEFENLIKITDPIAYLNCKDCDGFKKRLSIPKYIINAGNDEFFVPEALNVYINKLPGETDIRIAPNQGHDISNKIIEDALLTYYETIVFHAERPKLTWKVDKAGVVESISSNATPSKVKLWEAVNPLRRDFRNAAHVTYHSELVKGSCTDKGCGFPVAVTPPKTGFKVSFVEVTYEYGNGQQLVLTTPAYITAGMPTFTNAELSQHSEKHLA